MKSGKLPVVLLFFFLGIGALAAAAGGPMVLVLLLMGVPFIAFFLTLETIGHGHADNGHFRSPTQPR